jgi:sugar lactone lactonase YvrE
VAVDGKGNVYIADLGNQRVRKVSRGGTITTIAGTGKYGFSGDGGPATSARLYNPYGVAVDGKGNVYIADHLNSRVRKVQP